MEFRHLLEHYSGLMIYILQDARGLNSSPSCVSKAEKRDIVSQNVASFVVGVAWIKQNSLENSQVEEKGK